MTEQGVTKNWTKACPIFTKSGGYLDLNERLCDKQLPHGQNQKKILNSSPSAVRGRVSTHVVLRPA